MKKHSGFFGLPLFLNGSLFPCLVIGGGVGAVRKLHTLIESEVPCTVVAPECDPQIVVWEAEKKVRYIAKTFEPEDVRGFRIVVAATQDQEINDRIEQAARDERALFVSLSDAQSADFHFAASSKSQGVRFAVATDYVLPEVGQVLRDFYKEKLPMHFESQLQELSRLREIKKQAPTIENKNKYSSLLKTIQESLHQI